MSGPIKALSAILFSMGSIMLAAELFLDVVLRERPFSESVLPANWSVIGILGASGWVLGILLLVYLKVSAPGIRKDRKNIFLAGRKDFRCPSCRRTIDASRVGFHQKVDCPCGAVFNVFQETEWDHEP